jgi:hypothetical protein
VIAESALAEPRVFWSDDYAGLKTGELYFYFGYERTFCPHGKDADCDYCDDKEWCFTAYRGREEVARYTQSELDEGTDGRLDPGEPYGHLLAGIGRYLYGRL